MKARRIAVVGAGLAGLAAAFRLRRAGAEVVVFDTAGRAGGVVRSVGEDGWVAEEGAASLASPPRGRRRYVVRDGRLRALPASPPALLASSFFSPGARLRLMGAPFAPAPPPDADESVAAMVRRRLGPEVLAYAVDPFISGIYAGDPERLSVRHALPRLAALEAEHGSLLRGAMAMAFNGRPRDGERPALPRVFSFRGGMGALPAALADAVAPSFRLSARVTAIRRGASGDGWRVATDGDAQAAGEPFDAVIFTAPSHRAGGIAWDAENEGDVRAIAAIPHAPVAVLALGFRREDVAHPLDGFGVLCPSAERRAILGTLFSSTLFPGRAPAGHVLLTTFVGGVRDPDAVHLPAEWVRARVLGELRVLLGVAGAPVFEHLAVWPHAIPQPEVGHGERVRAMESLERRNPGLFLAGSWRAGVSVGDTLASGLRAADAALAHLATLTVAAPS